MNERLVNLYKSCRPKEALVSQEQYGSINVLLGSEVEKFAESIVYQMLEITGAHTEVFQTDRDKAVIEHIKQSIKTHFGVEE